VPQVRFFNRKRRQAIPADVGFDGGQNHTEKGVRKAIELNLSQVNAGASAERADIKFGTIIDLYRTKHLPTLEHSTQLENKYLLRRYIEFRHEGQK
jgi:ribosomal protein S24E